MNPFRTRSCVAQAVLLVLGVASCKRAPSVPERPEGMAAFKASQQATMTLKSFNVELARHTAMGEFKTSQSLDCSGPYFYEHEVTERSQYAIETDTSLSQGRPSAHQERDTMFVNGRTYHRNTSSWENAPANDDANPDWFVSSMPRDPKEGCASITLGAEFGYVPYVKIIQTHDIQYLGKQSVDGHDCYEYQISFPGQKPSDQMTTVDEGNGSSYSFTPMVNTIFRQKICLGAKDYLPYRVIGEDYTAIYNYADVVRLPAPITGAGAAQQQ